MEEYARYNNEANRNRPRNDVPVATVLESDYSPLLNTIIQQNEMLRTIIKGIDQRVKAMEETINNFIRTHETDNRDS
jgi:hypothetical protein